MAAVSLCPTRLAAHEINLSNARIELKPDYTVRLEIALKGSDVDRVEFFEESGLTRARLRFNLPGLVGSASPLPAFYSEQALGDRMG